jgi:hypothetical protein
MAVEDLVRQFAELSVQQDMALLSGPQRTINALYWKIDAIMGELKARPGDQRSALLALFDHENKQVQLKAALATLAISPHAARAQLEAIAASRWQPQAADAGMALIELDRGVYKPT